MELMIFIACLIAALVRCLSLPVLTSPISKPRHVRGFSVKRTNVLQNFLAAPPPGGGACALITLGSRKNGPAAWDVLATVLYLHVWLERLPYAPLPPQHFVAKTGQLMLTQNPC